MIKTFIHKGLEDFFFDGSLRKIQPKHSKKLALILDLLDAAASAGDMNFPGSRLHLLEPKQDKVWAVKVSGNWRVTFRFEDGDAYDVNYVDYH
ncbi:MAG TPA: peptidase [Chloroflexi bacterium]|nr:peptidase [Chloroflexota bacterium]